MPKYSVLETILVDEPDFNSLDKLTAEIEKKAGFLSEEIATYVKSLGK